MSTAEAPAPTRPRVEGDREVEIFDAVVRLVAETGYDKLTYDAVAGEVHASKATLYRKWPTKALLVVEAVVSRMCGSDDIDIDTGSLRGDLLVGACEDGGLTSTMPGLVSALMPALQRDPDFFEVFRERFIEPKLQRSLAVFARSVERGEIAPDADLVRLSTVLPAMCMHDFLLLGRAVGRDEVITMIDTVVLPACAATFVHRDAPAS
ncbi:TetR/AcrR family transcriptional regulator [Lapillicoccus sp.]|uniref:TetR/AcrR family transcriptional regulator n=1 Tax=Lapillicoccus sp. TaxID=1909287 RepID=UPI0025FDE80B|nr:TetR/AcrR family transcriptional regulator [Lapillicoccus sp.]